MFQEPRFLSADQFLLTTLIVKLAVMAVLATMLARYRRFRHILIFERRGWLDRLVFTLALAVPLMAGVAFRMLLNYNAADLTLEGAFLAGLIAGPYTGAPGRLPRRRARARLPASTRRFRSRSAAGLPAAACARRARRKRSGSSRPFVFVDLPKHVWKMVRRLETNWPLVLLLAAGRARAAAPGARRPLRRASAVLPRLALDAA